MSSILTPDDIRVLEKTLSIRERITDNLLKSDLPTKPREVDAFVNLLESMDRSVLGKAKIKVEESASRVNEETKAILTDLLLNLHQGNVPEGFDLEKPQQAPSFQSTGTEVLPGELIRKTDELGMDILDNLD